MVLGNVGVKMIEARPGQSPARCEVAFGWRASGRSGCQDDWQSAEHEPSDAAGRRQKQTEMLTSWLEPQQTNTPSSHLVWITVGQDWKKKTHTPAKLVPIVERVKIWWHLVPKDEFFYKNIWLEMMTPSSAAQPSSPSLRSPGSLRAYFAISSGTILPGLLQVSA